MQSEFPGSDSCRSRTRISHLTRRFVFVTETTKVHTSQRAFNLAKSRPIQVAKFRNRRLHSQERHVLVKQDDLAQQHPYVTETLIGIDQNKLLAEPPQRQMPLTIPSQ